MHGQSHHDKSTRSRSLCIRLSYLVFKDSLGNQLCLKFTFPARHVADTMEDWNISMERECEHETTLKMS